MAETFPRQNLSKLFPVKNYSVRIVTNVASVATKYYLLQRIDELETKKFLSIENIFSHDKQVDNSSEEDWETKKQIK